MLPTCFDNLETKLNERKKKSNTVTTKHLEKRQVHQVLKKIVNRFPTSINKISGGHKHPE